MASRIDSRRLTAQSIGRHAKNNLENYGAFSEKLRSGGFQNKKRSFLRCARIAALGFDTGEKSPPKFARSPYTDPPGPRVLLASFFKIEKGWYFF